MPTLKEDYNIGNQLMKGKPITLKASDNAMTQIIHNERLRYEKKIGEPMLIVSLNCENCMQA